MTIKVGINGFGRIGRMVFRAAAKDLIDAPKFAGIEFLFERLQRRVKTHHVTHHQLLVHRARFFDEARAFFNCCGNRFFDQNIHSRIERVHANFFMQRGWNNDRNRIGLFFFKHFAMVGVGADSKFFRGRMGADRIRIRDGN